MTENSELQRLAQALKTCRTHKMALNDAMEEIQQKFTLDERIVTRPGKAERRVLDQFAYRYTRLQDDMGARLLPAILAALGEDIAPMAVLDRLNRLEQLGWLPSAEEWTELRRIRNEFTHEYPEKPAERLEKLTLALNSARRLIELLNNMESRIQQRFMLPSQQGDFR